MNNTAKQPGTSAPRRRALDMSALSRHVSSASIVILVILFTAMNRNFVSVYNVKNILTDMSPLLAMASGVAFVIFLGSIDLSIGSIASCSAVLTTLLLQTIGPPAYLVVIGFGMSAGILNGILYTKLKVPSFIATLSTQSIWQSAAYLLSGGMPLTLFPPSWKYVAWAKAAVWIIPLMFFMAVTFMLLCHVIQSRLIVGKTMLAIGSNERAARLMGLNIDRAKMIAFLFSGLGASLGGIFFAVKLKSGIPTVGEQYTLMAIAATVLGGISLSGGRGTILLTILGVGLITIIQNGMNVIAVGGFWQQIVFGILVLVAIYMNTDRERRDLIVK